MECWIMRKLKIAHKLPLMMMGMVFSSVLIIGGFAIHKGKHDAVLAAKQKLSAINLSRANALKTYLNGIDQDLSFLAKSPYVKDAANSFKNAWLNMGNFQTEKLQQAYITDNPHPVGSKEALDFAESNTIYDQQHKKYHPWFREFLKLRGYYDIFLFDPKGNLIYTVFKELDYATNINTGQWYDTDLGEVFRAAKNHYRANKTVFKDFKAYAPSHGAPASFLSAPILNDDGSLVAILAFQMPISRINQVMQLRAGLGKTGDAYLVGEDGFMRTDSVFSKYSTILKTQLSGSIIHTALETKEGTMETQNAKGVDVIAAYALIHYHGTKWIVITEMTQDEIQAPIRQMQFYLFICMLLVTTVTGIVGFTMSRGISKPIEKLTDSMKQLSVGEVNFSIPRQKGDEIGEMGEALEVFRGNRIENHQYEGQIAAINKSLAIVEFDMNGIVLNANENFLYIMGYRLNEIQGKHHRMFVRKEFSRSAQYERLWQKLNEGAYDSGEYMFIGKEGGQVWIQASYNPILDLDNKPFKVVKYCSRMVKLKG